MVLQGKSCRDKILGSCSNDGSVTVVCTGIYCRDGAVGTALQGLFCRDGAAGMSPAAPWGPDPIHSSPPNIPPNPFPLFRPDTGRARHRAGRHSHRVHTACAAGWVCATRCRVAVLVIGHGILQMTCVGVQHPLTCAGMQHPLTCARMQHPLTCTGMQHPLTCAGMQHPLTCAWRTLCATGLNCSASRR